MGLKNIIITLFLALFVIVLIVINSEKNQSQKPSKPSVVLSTFTLFDVAKHISKDKFELSSALPFGVDAHSFELTPKKMIDIQNSNLFVYSGASLEPWISKITAPNSLDMSKFVNLIHLQDKDEEHHSHSEHGHHHDMDEHGEVIDPHYWLDINNMIKISNKLCEEFIKISPKDKDFFELNKEKYVNNLIKMDKRYTKDFASCKKDTLVVNHNGFSYLGKMYNFHIKSISGLSTDSMPSPESIKKILHLIDEKKISIIFFESFASDKLVKSIANDTKIDVDTLQPLGNITKDEHGMTYAQIMDRNVEKIKKALECR